MDEASTIIDRLAFPRDVMQTALILSDVLFQRENYVIDTFIEHLRGNLGEDRWNASIVEVEDENMHALFRKHAGNRAIMVIRSLAGTRFRENPTPVLSDLDPSWSLDAFHAFNRDVNIELTRARIKSVSEQNDRLIIQAVNSIDDINRSANIYAERIREWYGYHFPELTDQLVSDHAFFLEIVSSIGERSEFTADKLKSLRPIPDRTVDFILKRAGESMGGSFSPYDVKMVQAFARNVLDLFKTRDEIETYIDSLMEQTCPNLSALIGPLLGARLICLAGGLEALAKKPSSTIQVLGAEKALFRALKVKGDPPKHGVIFQAKEVRNAAFWQRGKIARLLAGKILIAARVDQVSRRYMADELIDDVAKKIEEIKRKYPDKPVQKKAESTRAYPRKVPGRDFKGGKGPSRNRPGGYRQPRPSDPRKGTPSGSSRDAPGGYKASRPAGTRRPDGGKKPRGPPRG